MTNDRTQRPPIGAQHDPTRDARGPVGGHTIPGGGPAVVPGQVLDGKYRLDKKVAEGGMGAVWQATHLHLQSPIAVKVLTPELREQPQAIERFWHEARMMGGLGHPNIVRVLDVSSPTAPLPYIVMELLPGESLRSRMKRRGVFSTADACVVLDGILTALIVAHRQGIVHRDLKPENVFLVPRADDDHGPGFMVKVLDFGASKLLDDERDPHLTRAGGFLGTPMYMAPEQAGGGSVTHRADLYSAGVVFYEMISGNLPHRADNVQALLMRLMTTDATPITTHNPNVHPIIVQFLARALVRDPAARFATADDMRKAVRHLPLEHGSKGPQLLETDEHMAYRAALDEVDASSDAHDMFPTLSPMEPGVQALRSTDQGASMLAAGDPRVAAPEPAIELDLPTVEARARSGRGRPTWPVVLVLLLAAAPAYGVWEMRKAALAGPLEAEMVGVIADPRGVRDGRLRPPREIEPELDAAKDTAMYQAGMAWAGASILGLLAWIVVARRR